MSARRLKVGVTLYVRRGQQSVWENGIFQNGFFLVSLLQKSPAGERAFVVNGGDRNPREAGDFLALALAPVIDMDTAMRGRDIVIELSAQFNPQSATEFRSRRGRVVGMRVADDYAIDIERMIFGRPPAFERTTRASAPSSQFAYQPGRRAWRAAVLEPNLCMVKTGFIPLFVCELAHRQDPRMLEYVQVFNTVQFTGQAEFVDTCRNLDLVNHGIATLEGRFPVFQILPGQADVVAAHSWENAQNHVYYEALYGGFPLVPNSELIGTCGYRYEAFDCHGGALALRQAHAEHDLRPEDYRREAQAFLHTLDPENPANVASYSAALVELSPSRREYA